MNVFELTRALIDIESITNNEEAGRQLPLRLPDDSLAARFGGRVERIEVEPRRFNVFAQWGEPLVVTLSTHIDTVPPFFTSREDDEHIWGRGACDTKGIIAAMIKAVEAMLEAGERGFGLLFVVGEERNSAGAYRAAQTPRGSRYIINGEPTENRLALGSKGSLRYEVVATGKMAHSAYPELGDSAIHKLIDVLAEMRRIPLPVDPLLGPSTLEHRHALRRARAQRGGGRGARRHHDPAGGRLRAKPRRPWRAAAEGRAELREVIEIPAMHLNSVDGIETTVVAFTTDIPAFGGSGASRF